MSQNRLEIEDGINSFALEFTSRDFGILGGPSDFMKLGVDFIKTLGVYENTSVFMNMQVPEGSKVRRKRGYLLMLTRSLLNYMERDADLLAYDYSFRLTKGEGRHRLKGHLTGFRIRDYFGSVTAQPQGFCTLTLMESSPTGAGRTVEIIDLRNREEIPTDDKGTLKVYRKEAEFGWPESLRSLIQFLETSKEKEVVIHHSNLL